MIVDCPGCQLRYRLPERAPGTRARCRCGTTFPIPAEPKVAASLQCPSCGAASDPAKQRCTYCSTSLAVVACPSCFGMIFAGTRHCQHCGVRADRGAKPAEATESARHCARCPERPVLIAALVGGVMLDRCESCEGTFVDRVSVETLVTDRDRQATLHNALTVADELTLPPAGVGAVKYLPCPECQAMMQRKNFGRVSGVIVDVCKIHGTWFDADELRRIVEFVQKGGLDKARKLEINELEREIENKRDRMRNVNASYGPDRYMSPAWGDQAVAGAIQAAFDVIIGRLW